MQLCPAGSNRPPSDSKYPLTSTSPCSHFLCDAWPWQLLGLFSQYTQQILQSGQRGPSWPLCIGRIWFSCITRGNELNMSPFLLFVCTPPGVRGVYVSAESWWLSSNRVKTSTEAKPHWERKWCELALDLAERIGFEFLVNEATAAASRSAACVFPACWLTLTLISETNCRWTLARSILKGNDCQPMYVPLFLINYKSFGPWPRYFSLLQNRVFSLPPPQHTHYPFSLFSY